jgi:hypothetical protein
MSANKADVMAKRERHRRQPHYGTRTIHTRVVNVPKI